MKLVRALLRAEKLGRDDQPRTVDAIVKYLKLDRALIEKAYVSGNLEQGTDPNLHGVQKFWRTMRESDFVEASAPGAKDPIAKHVELSIYREALDGLAKEDPGEPYWVELTKRFAERNL